MRAVPMENRTEAEIALGITPLVPDLVPRWIDTKERLVSEVSCRMAELGLGADEAALASGLPKDRVSGLMRGEGTLDDADALLRALGVRALALPNPVTLMRGAEGC